MDLDTAGKIASLISSAVVAIGAGVTAWIAVRSLNKWHSEMSGKHEYDTARGLIRATYKVRDQLARCRAPFFHGDEFGENKQDAEGWRTAYVARWAPVGKALEEFDVATLEAEALWGRDVRSKAQAMHACVGELFAAIEAILDDKRAGGADFAADREFGKKMRATAWSGSGSKNELTKAIADAVSGVEDELRPRMTR